LVGFECGRRCCCAGCYEERRGSRLVGLLTCMDGSHLFETFSWGGAKVVFGSLGESLDQDLFVLCLGGIGDRKNIT
jgi:hypothetical protein